LKKLAEMADDYATCTDENSLDARLGFEHGFRAGFDAAKEAAEAELRRYISREPDGTPFKKIVLTSIHGIQGIAFD
jgi:hypothetical protein